MGRVTCTTFDALALHLVSQVVFLCHFWSNAYDKLPVNAKQTHTVRNFF